MIIIAAPFGNYLKFNGTIRTLGTFTKEQRKGRWWRVFLTLRYYWRAKAWINKIGLRNPGLLSLTSINPVSDIVSIHGFRSDDWYWLVSQLLFRFGDKGLGKVEFNLSCPNTNKIVSNPNVISNVIKEVSHAIKVLEPNKVIAKLPPIRWFDYAVPLFDLGVRWFHLCNTIPTPGGGISGAPLKQYSLWAINQFREKWGNQIILIGGGGINNLNDIEEYKAAGVDHFSFGTMLFNPINWWRIRKWVKEY